ncbi:hypothetical protein THRCLA_00804 [Thraustotheca clavata]|uniref:Ribosomal protein eL8/eL30/eS12/Gadd45 domain-containing protein n=1 Tax=Thraustotheca clavata TaxID=74557 RepID=A0A1W0AA71_9STRA|nr:hypothetical protein THRCLA_00804 [Thraustotheca clavata]
MSLRAKATQEKAIVREELRKERWMPYAVLEQEEADILIDRIKKEAVPVMMNEPMKSLVKPLRLVALGVNQVAKLIEEQNVRVLVLSMDNSMQDMCHHIVVMAKQFEIPICVVPMSTSALGAIFNMKRVSVIGFRRVPSQADNETLQDALIQMRSIQDFVISKASTLNDILS